MKIKAIDLFSGCGGVSIGLINSGFEVASAVEIDGAAVAAYKRYPKLSGVNVLQQDICSITGNEILKAGHILKSEIYLLAGCPPCQKFSLQNRKNNNDIDNIEVEKDVKKLLMQFKRIIKEIYPPFILMENVPGIKSSFGGKILAEFIRDLKNTDGEIREQYNIKYDVLNAADYGVPQTRKRFVLHAVRKDIDIVLKKNNIDFELPRQTHCKGGNEDLSQWVTVWDVIGDLPPIKAGERLCSNIIKNHYCAKLSDKNIVRIKTIRQNGGSRIGLPEELVLTCHKKYKGHTDVYGIMKADQPSPTITGGCLSYSKGRFGHPTQDRAMSVREAARLQTFPDDFIFGENLGAAAIEIGNAVPIKLVEASGKTIISIIKAYKLNLKKFS